MPINRYYYTYAYVGVVLQDGTRMDTDDISLDEILTMMVVRQELVNFCTSLGCGNEAAFMVDATRFRVNMHATTKYQFMASSFQPYFGRLERWHDMIYILLQYFLTG